MIRGFWGHMTGLTVLIVIASATPASTFTTIPVERVIHTFVDGKDGSGPTTGLIADKNGDLFGTTTYGGGGPCQVYGYTGCGTIYEMIRNPANGTWSQKVLYAFQGQDGDFPDSALVPDNAGNLYGTTSLGGHNVCGITGSAGCGVVFKLAPPSMPSGAWTESVIYDFTSNEDGVIPTALIADPSGNLFGVTSYGGTVYSRRCVIGCGSVFELTPNNGGRWTKSSVYEFQGPKIPTGYGDGQLPIGLTFDKRGNLFGTTVLGGQCQGGEGGGCFGTVFEMKPHSSACSTWCESVIHRFNQVDQNPVSGVTIDRAGAIYTTTYVEAIQLVRNQDRWVAAVLHTFDGITGNGDGYLPYGGVILDKFGNLFGTTIGGGSPNNPAGIVYKLTRPSRSGDPWQETILHDFARSPDGEAPDAPLMIGTNGVIYGTTLRGGTKTCLYYSNIGCGTVFKVTQ